MIETLGKKQNSIKTKIIAKPIIISETLGLKTFETCSFLPSIKKNSATLDMKSI